jgi:hypothetical protein
MVVAEQSTEAFSPHHVTRLATHCSLRRDESITELLVIALSMVMDQVLFGHIGERSFAEHEHAIQGFFCDGLNLAKLQKSAR